MASQLYNNVSDALLNSIDNVQTSFDLVSGNIPAVDAGDYIPIYVLRSSDGAFEVMHVISVSGSTVTVDRAEENTSPLTFPSGEAVQIRPTRQSLAEMDVSDSEVTTSTGAQSLDVALDERLTIYDISGFAEKQEVDITVNIPTDYATLQDAVDDLSTISVAQGHIIDLVIESGHQPTAGISVANGDYSHFRISSADATVSLDAAFPATDIIRGVNARMPVLNCKIDAGGLGYSGYCAEEVSYGKVTAGNGVINAGRYGLYANDGSTVFANSTVWTGASQESPDFAGILAWASRIVAEDSDVSNSLYYGAQAAAGGVLSFRNGIANNTGRYGVRATNMGTIDARACTASGNSVYGIYAYIASTINAMGATADNNGEANVIALRGSTIDFSVEGAFASSTNGGGSVASLYAALNSRISAGGASVSNSTGKGILAEGGSIINITAGSISGSTGFSAEASSSSIINAVTATISGGTDGIRCSASTASVRAVAFSGQSGTPVNVREGSTIQAHGATVGGAAFTTSNTNADTLNGFSTAGPEKGILWA